MKRGERMSNLKLKRVKFLANNLKDLEILVLFNNRVMFKILDLTETLM